MEWVRVLCLVPDRNSCSSRIYTATLAEAGRRGRRGVLQRAARTRPDRNVHLRFRVTFIPIVGCRAPCPDVSDGEATVPRSECDTRYFVRSRCDVLCAVTPDVAHNRLSRGARC